MMQKKMRLINLSNHPKDQWGTRQLETAEQWGEVIDLPFPEVSPTLSSEGLDQLVDEYFQMIVQETEKYSVTVHVMGEMTFTYRLVNRLKEVGITCIASTSRRLVEEQPNGGKLVTFEFEKFREY